MKLNKQTNKKTWKWLCSVDASELLLSNPSRVKVASIFRLSCSVNTANFTRWLIPVCLITREPNQRSSLIELIWRSETMWMLTEKLVLFSCITMWYYLKFILGKIYTGSAKVKVFSDYLDRRHSLALSTFDGVQSGDSYNKYSLLYFWNKLCTYLWPSY